MARQRRLSVRDAMARAEVSVKEHDSLESAVRLMLGRRVHALPVTDDRGAVVGILTDMDALAVAAGVAAAPESIEDVPVEQLMTKEPVAVDPDATLGEAAGALLESGFRHLPVVDEDRRLVGIISERDLRARLGTDLKSWEAAPDEALEDRVSRIMTADPTVVQVGTRLGSVIDTFTTEAIGALPVVDEGERLVGIVSYVDVLRWLRGRASAEPVALPPP